MAFSGCFLVSKVGRVGGADGTANAKAQKCEAASYVQSNNQIDISVCVRERMVKRMAEEASRGLYVKIPLYHGKKLILHLVEHCLPNFLGDR